MKKNLVYPKIDTNFIVITVPARTLRRFRVALDIEGCIDRFYGGYYSGKI
jgi:hypothetical protein